MKADKVYLVGFMGSGKSSVARALARRLSWDAVDLDELIEKREHATVADIFKRRGEPYFRAAERSALADQMRRRHVVIATGGGTYADPENRAAISRDGVAVWLDVPFDTLVARVPADGRRPLAANRAEFERLFNLRRVAYAQAHLRLDAGRASIGELAEQLADWLAR